MDTNFFRMNDIPYVEIEIKDMTIIDRNEIAVSQSYKYFEPIDEEGNINLKQIVKSYNHFVDQNKNLEQPGYLNEGQNAEYITSIKIVGLFLTPLKEFSNALKNRESIQKRNEAMLFLEACEKIKDDPYNGKTHDEFLLENKDTMRKDHEALNAVDYYGFKNLGKTESDFNETCKARINDYKKKQLESALKELENDAA